MSPAFDLQTCARPNILRLTPYRCARDDYKDDGTNILLDANENALGSSLPSGLSVTTEGLHRYPDPHQIPLKALFCDFRNSQPTPILTPRPLQPENLFLGVGSDEAIDALLRVFCVPGVERCLVCPPTYGMYTVSAAINDVQLIKVPLLTDLPKFPIDVPAIEKTLSEDKRIKLVYLCSPGNPTGALISPADIRKLLDHPTYNGLIVVDEAYIDFSPAGSSLSRWVTEFPNLVVMQTLSKGFGLAGIRLGAVFCDAAVAAVLNAMKAPYSVSSLTSDVASAALSEEGKNVGRGKMRKIVEQRERVVEALKGIEGVGRIRGGLDANFILVEMLDIQGGPSNGVAQSVYETLAEEKGVVVRFRGKELGCEGCLRLTVGTEQENSALLEKMEEVLRLVRGK